MGEAHCAYILIYVYYNNQLKNKNSRDNIRKQKQSLEIEEEQQQQRVGCDKRGIEGDQGILYTYMKFNHET